MIAKEEVAVSWIETVHERPHGHAPLDPDERQCNEEETVYHKNHFGLTTSHERSPGSVFGGCYTSRASIQIRVTSTSPRSRFRRGQIHFHIRLNWSQGERIHARSSNFVGHHSLRIWGRDFTFDLFFQAESRVEHRCIQRESESPPGGNTCTAMARWYENENTRAHTHSSKIHLSEMALSVFEWGFNNVL